MYGIACCTTVEARRFERHEVITAAILAAALLILASSLRTGAAGIAALITVLGPVMIASIPRPQEGVVDGPLMAAAGVLTLFAGVAWGLGLLEPGTLAGPTGAALLVIFRSAGTRTNALIACAAILGGCSLVGQLI